MILPRFYCPSILSECRKSIEDLCYRLFFLFPKSLANAPVAACVCSDNLCQEIMIIPLHTSISFYEKRGFFAVWRGSGVWNISKFIQNSTNRIQNLNLFRKNSLRFCYVRLRPPIQRQLVGVGWSSNPSKNYLSTKVSTTAGRTRHSWKRLPL